MEARRSFTAIVVDFGENTLEVDRSVDLLDTAKVTWEVQNAKFDDCFPWFHGRPDYQALAKVSESSKKTMATGLLGDEVTDFRAKWNAPWPLPEVLSLTDYIAGVSSRHEALKWAYDAPQRKNLLKGATTRQWVRGADKLDTLKRGQQARRREAFKAAGIKDDI